MPCKLRYSLTALAVIALVAAFASSAAQAQFKNATGATKGTDIRPWTTTHGSNRAVPNRANDRLRSAGPATRNGCYDNDPNTPCLNSMVAGSARPSNKQQRQVQGGTMLDKPTFGEKFMMSPDKSKSVNSVKGTKPQRGNTERELMDLMSEGRRN
jgi:hypothetical protein